jgi:hypothetical protein
MSASTTTRKPSASYTTEDGYLIEAVRRPSRTTPRGRTLPSNVYDVLIDGEKVETLERQGRLYYIGSTCYPLDYPLADARLIVSAAANALEQRRWDALSPEVQAEVQVYAIARSAQARKAGEIARINRLRAEAHNALQRLAEALAVVGEGEAGGTCLSLAAQANQVAADALHRMSA